MAALCTAKQALRKEIKRRVAQLSDQEKCRQSQIISQKLLRHPKYVSCKRVAVFLSMRDEACTEEILQDIFRQGKTCFVPRYEVSRGNHMDMLRLSGLQDVESLPQTSWDVRQPAWDDDTRGEALATGGLDLILMPGLGFDPSGRRLGRGKGFYDAYLRRCVQEQGFKPYTIGLAFREQLCPEVPVDEHDVLIDEVLYPEPPE